MVAVVGTRTQRPLAYETSVLPLHYTAICGVVADAPTCSLLPPTHAYQSMRPSVTPRSPTDHAVVLYRVGTPLSTHPDFNLRPIGAIVLRVNTVE